MGHSMGGMNLSLMMEQYPEKIRASVFVTTFMPLSGSSAMKMITEVQERIESWGDNILMVEFLVFIINLNF